MIYKKEDKKSLPKGTGWRKGKSYETLYGSIKANEIRRKAGETIKHAWTPERRLAQAERFRKVGYQNRGRKISVEHVAALRAGHRRLTEAVRSGEVENKFACGAEAHRKQGETLKRKWHEDEEFRQKQIAAKIESFKNMDEDSRKKFFARGIETSFEVRKNHPEFRLKLSQSHKRLWENADFRERMTTAFRKRSQDPTLRTEHSKRLKIAFQDPALRKRVSEGLKLAYRLNPECHGNRHMKHPSKLQIELFAFLKQVFADAEMEYPIVTNASTRFADIGVPSCRIDVEYDGDYWHLDKAADLERDIELAEVGWFVFHVDARALKRMRGVPVVEALERVGL